MAPRRTVQVMFMVSHARPDNSLREASDSYA
jgi:hypothetical protein